MLRKTTWLLGVLVLSCASERGPREREVVTEASILAELDSLEVVEGSFSGGDATIAYRAHLRPGGEIVYVHESNDFGDYGASRPEFFLRDGYLFSYRATSEGPGSDGGRKTVETSMTFDAPGSLSASRKTIDGLEVALDPHEPDGALRHLETIRVAVDAALSARTVDRPGELAGRYAAELRAASSPGRSLTLILSTDHSARLSADVRNGEPPIEEEGSWRALPESRAAVELRWWKNERVPATRFTFELEGDSLATTEWDREAYGSEGLQLRRIARFGVLPAEVLERTWVWESFEDLEIGRAHV